MSATGNQDMDTSALGQAGNPGAVVTSINGQDTTGASALNVDGNEPRKQRVRPKLPPPTSIVEEQKKKRLLNKKQKPPNLNIPKEDNNPKEENKMKQPSIKEFVQFTKKKAEEKESAEKEEEHYFNQKDPEDKSREATIMEVFHGICHIEERFHQAIKANDEKWKAAKRIDEKRIVALTKMVKSQGNRLTLLETTHKKVMKGNLTEIMEINRQIYGGEFKKTTNKAENELRKTEESAKAAQDELGIWADEPEFILDELEEAGSSLRTPFVQTPRNIPSPITPNTHGAFYRVKQKTKSGPNQPGQNAEKGKNINNHQEKPKERTWADVSKLNIPTEVMETKDPREYAQKVASLNKIVPNHIPEERPEAARKPKVAADMEKIANVIGIKNINWSETRTHAVGHEKNKGDARREVLAKGPTYAEARVRYAILHINSRMGIPINKLPITEAWSASNVESKIMWIKADRETISLIKNVKAEAHRLRRPINIEFMEWTPGNHRQIREDIKGRCSRLKEFNKHWWVKVVPGAPGNSNFQIEVSHSKRKKFIKTDYNLFMEIPLTNEPEGPQSAEKKEKKRTRLEQDPDEQRSYRDIMKDIESRISDAYEEAHDAIQGSNQRHYRDLISSSFMVGETCSMLCQSVICVMCESSHNWTHPHHKKQRHP